MSESRIDWTVALTAAGVAAVATTATLALLGKKETGSAAAPINAVSHIAWGDEAATKDATDVKHTAVGEVLHAGANLAWAVAQELLFGKWMRAGGPGRTLVAGGLTSALAYVTDYFVVPKRLTPGFEMRLSKGSLGLTYLVLALSLAAGSAVGNSVKNAETNSAP